MKKLPQKRIVLSHRFASQQEIVYCPAAVADRLTRLNLSPAQHRHAMRLYGSLAAIGTANVHFGQSLMRLRSVALLLGAGIVVSFEAPRGFHIRLAKPARPDPSADTQADAPSPRRFNPVRLCALCHTPTRGQMGIYANTPDGVAGYMAPLCGMHEDVHEAMLQLDELFDQRPSIAQYQGITEGIGSTAELIYQLVGASI
jgi:hypothetical protein